MLVTKRSRRRAWRVLAVATAVAVLLGVLPAAAADRASEPAAQPPAEAATDTGRFDETVLWDSAEGPHESYHVQGLAVTPADTILAFTEGRHEVCDAGPRDIVLRRSTDGGDTWEPSRVVVPSDDGQSWGNPTPVVDEETGEIFLFFGLSLLDPANIGCSGDYQEIYLSRSTDDGVTWSSPVEMDELFAGNPYGWTLHGPGPGHGIQLQDGRLVMQVLHRRQVVGHTVAERLYGVSAIYSDDHGATWQAGEPIPVDVNYPINESRIYERADGAIAVNGRSAAGGHRQRIAAVSTDGGETWSDPVHEPATGRYNAVDAGFLRFEGADGVGRLLHSRPDSARRENLTVSVSYDDGATYRYDKIVNPGASYYSDLAVLSDGTILLFYGRDGEILGSPARLVMARFDLAWLTGGRDTGDDAGLAERGVELGDVAGTKVRPPSGAPASRTVTPDVAGGHDAVVTGQPEATDGGFVLDGDDHLEIPPADPVLAAGDAFTATAWFRTEQSESQAILWAYGLGSATPQWWLRAEPGSNRIRALVDTGHGTASLTAPGSYADGEWHHVALTRADGTLALYVDGAPVAQTASPTGSLSFDARDGVHVGQRPDGENRLTGGIDDVRLYDRALAAGEVAALAAGRGEAGGPAGAVVHLPLDTTTSQRVPRPQPVAVADGNARGGAALDYQAGEPGDYVEIPFRLPRDEGAFEVAVRYARTWANGEIEVSIDGAALPTGVVDPSLDSGSAYQTYQHGTVELGRGLHRIRFTLVGPGRLGGTAIAVDELTLITAEHPSDEAHRDVLVDDESVGAFRMTGTWGRATGQAGHPYFGVSYRSAPAGTGDRRASWQLDVPVAGEYNVLAWSVAHANRASDAPFTVNHADGSTTVEIDQRGQARAVGDSRPGVWVDLGRYRFEAGAAGSVELANDADGFVIADAVLLTRDSVPGRTADVAAEPLSASTVRVTWAATDGADGYHVERRAAGARLWEFAGQTAAGATALDVTGLAPATAYEFRVYAVADTEPGRPGLAGTASAPVSATTAEAGDGEGDGTLALSVLSSRPDAVSGDDALVRVDVDASVPLDDVAVTLNDVDVTASFTADTAGHSLTGLVTGLHTGANALAAQAGTEASRTTLELTGHPIEGPVFSGPHQPVFRCGTASFTVPVIGGTLGAPLDENCSIADRVDYFYRTTGDTFAPWPAGATAYPADLATTTTSDGAEVPFVVRMETGTVNRAVYQTTVLHDPLADPEPSAQAPPPAWNGGTVFTLGGGCTSGWYRQGTRTGGVDDLYLLGQGYGVMSSSLNVFGNNCNDVLAAETASMVKERFIERYGPVDHVIGFGCSGGSYQAYQITDNYPGIFDGIIVGCSFPDVAFSTVHMITDAWLLHKYFTDSELAWTEEQRLAVTGFGSDATPAAVAPGARRIDPREYCTMVPAAQRYHPDTNPTGLRCGVYDHTVNVYGRDPATGFARRPLDNEGIQYGLGALNSGDITPEQFLDLNEHIGGFDDDANLIPERTSADVEAIRTAYRTGRLTSGGGGLADVPIIDYRTYRDDNPNGELHVRYHTFSMLERLRKANGTTANHVSLLEDLRHGGFTTASPLLQHAVDQLDTWLRDLAADDSDAPRIDKIVAARPDTLLEGCNTRDAEPVFVAETLDGDPAGECEQLYPTASFPRAVAGESVASDVVKCQRAAPRREDYDVDWTDEQWHRLTTVFADGVCDYSRPGVEQQGLAGTWLRF